MASLLPLHNFYSILIHLPEPSSSEAGETWVRNMAAEFCLRSICFMLLRFFCFTSCYGFLSPIKIHRPRPGLNPRTLGPVASTLTTRPPRPFSFGFVELHHAYGCRNSKPTLQNTDVTWIGQHETLIPTEKTWWYDTVNSVVFDEAHLA
jgi:hypothetical protein